MSIMPCQCRCCRARRDDALRDSIYEIAGTKLTAALQARPTPPALTVERLQKALGVKLPDLQRAADALNGGAQK